MLTDNSGNCSLWALAARPYEDNPSAQHAKDRSPVSSRRVVRYLKICRDYMSFY